LFSTFKVDGLNVHRKNSKLTWQKGGTALLKLFNGEVSRFCEAWHWGLSPSEGLGEAKWHYCGANEQTYLDGPLQWWQAGFREEKVKASQSNFSLLHLTHQA
jgi:hypothetical protein